MQVSLSEIKVCEARVKRRKTKGEAKKLKVEKLYPIVLITRRKLKTFSYKCCLVDERGKRI